jgi:hypothetical protein
MEKGHSFCLCKAVIKGGRRSIPCVAPGCCRLAASYLLSLPVPVKVCLLPNKCRWLLLVMYISCSSLCSSPLAALYCCLSGLVLEVSLYFPFFLSSSFKETLCCCQRACEGVVLPACTPCRVPDLVQYRASFQCAPCVEQSKWRAGVQADQSGGLYGE